MNKINWDTYKIRCSALPTLMTVSRSKTDPLSETAKAYLREIWIKEVFNREKYDKSNKYTDKGISCESDSLDLYKQVTDKTLFKNKKNFENDFIKGTPDLVLNNCVIDIKTPWDLWTFMAVNEDVARKDYLFQLVGYAWLVGVVCGQITYCLVNTPQEIVSTEMYKLSFRFDEIGTSDKADEKYLKNYKFDDIEPKLRFKSYGFLSLLDYAPQVEEKVLQCREYLKGLSL